MNIVLLTDCLGDITGGAEKQIFELAKRLPKDRYNVFIASMEAQGETSEPLIRSIGCRLMVFRVVRIYGLSGFIQGIRFLSFLRANAIHTIITYHFGSDIWGTFWGHLAGVPSIISNRRDMGFWRNQSHVAAYRLINRWVNTIVTVTSSIKHMVLQTEKVSGEKVEIVYNGVDLERPAIDLQQKRSETGLKPQDTVIIHVANLRPVKGHTYLIEAFAEASKHFNDIKLMLIGKDELNGQLQSLSGRLGVKDKILFLGQRTDVGELLAVSDICVLPSLSEGMSNAILEYMAFEKPVIATNVGGNPELVQNGYNGLLVDKENAGQLAEALLALLKDKEKRQTMGHNGLLRVKADFSMEAMMARYEKLFKKKIKILHLVSSGGLFGAERVILNIASQHRDADFWVGALNNQHNPHLEIIQEAQKLGLKTAVFDSRNQADFKTVSSIKKFLKENSIDIVHTHNYKSDIMGFLATRFTGVKWAATNHVWHSTDKKLRLYEAMDAFVLKFASAVFTVSQEIKDDLLKKGFKEDHLHVVHNGIAVDQFGGTAARKQLRDGWHVSGQDVLLIIAGRLAPEKGHDILFKSLKKATTVCPSVKCLVAGDGPLRAQLEELAREPGLSGRIIFTGIRKDMPDVYCACDMMINASSIEGLPMTILEAMASKLPVIATKVGAVPQVIKNGQNGILLEYGNVDALSQSIVDLANAPEIRQALARQAYTDVSEHFSDRRMAEEYMNFYQKLL